MISEVEWVLDCKPRPVQLEALRRSFYGVALHDEEGNELEEEKKIREGAARGWGHFLEMRLGKTPLALNELMLLNAHYGVKKALILSPNTYKPEWVREAKVFGFGMPIFMSDTPTFGVLSAQLRKMKEWVLVANYEALQYDPFLFMMDQLQGDDSALFADESIKLKNPKGLFTKRALDLKKQVTWKRVMSGRPITQGPQDLYAQLKFIGQLNGKNFYAFRNKYCKMGGFKNKKVVGVRDEEILKSNLDRCSFTAKRKDWSVVKVPDYTVDNIEMSPRQQELYHKIQEDMFLLFENGQEVTTEQVITRLMKQQQISSGFLYDDEGNLVRFIEPKNVPKLCRTVELIEEADGKVIVPYHYNESGDMLAEALSKWDPAFIRSQQWMKQNGKNTLDEKDKFNNTDCKIAIVSLEAVKYGNTLIGNEKSRATTMVFYENTYSLDTRSQVEMRNVYTNQDWTNLYIDFASSKVESDVIKALIHKESLVEAIFGSYRVLKEERKLT